MLKKLILVLCLAASSVALAQNQVTVPAKPLVEAVSQKLAPVKTSGPMRVPLITWGGDVATILAQKDGLFKAEGLNTEIFLENNFPNQVAACLSGKTPFLRGTMGMINAASEVFKARGTDLVVIYQLTWSTGGDALVVRKNVRKPSNLKGKTVALQLYGPHMDYLANILSAASVPLDRVDLRWFNELTLPAFDTGGKTLDPVSAFLEDKDIDGVMCIIPDAMALTSGGKTGSGADGSVKGAKVMVSTKTASKVIADVYAVRADYFAKNKSKVMAFTRALLKSSESLRDLAKNKASQRAAYQQLMSQSADLLLGAPQAVPDIEALLGDCSFAGYNGNVAFFTGKGTTRTLKNLSSEIQRSFVKLKLVNKRVALKNANWDYSTLASGLKYASDIPQKKKKFDTKKVAAKIEKQISVEPTSWAEEGTLFQIEINFAPNQSEFTETQYAGDFQKALEISQTYGGSLIVVEGHSDPLGVLRARQKKKPSIEIQQMEQQAKNLSLQRAQAVRSSFLKYCKAKSIPVDTSQFVAVGLGTSSPKFSPPRTKEEWAANRRVVFRIKQVEAELSEFVPLD